MTTKFKTSRELKQATLKKMGIEKPSTKKWIIFGDVKITISSVSTGDDNWFDYAINFERDGRSFKIVETTRLDFSLQILLNALQETVIIGSKSFSDFCSDCACNETDLARYRFWRDCALVIREYENMFTTEEQNMIEEYDDQIVVTEVRK